MKRRENRDMLFSILNTGTNITGDINSENELCIHGLVCGTVNAERKLVIGASANIKGDVYSPDIVVFGEVNGNFFSDGIVTLKKACKVAGNISCNRLEIEAGAEFNGECIMKYDKESLK